MGPGTARSVAISASPRSLESTRILTGHLGQGRYKAPVSKVVLRRSFGKTVFSRELADL